MQVSTYPPLADRSARGADANRVAAGRPLWLWWHVLSLDAPTVALLWAHLFAAVAHVRLTWQDDLALAGVVWLVYIADRILDGALTADRASLRVRHHFAYHHRRALAAVWLLVLLGVAALIRFGLERATIEAGVALLGVVILYLSSVHVTPDNLRPDWTKRALVAVIFSLGTALPAWAHAGHPAPLAWPVAAFALLCFLNCTAIETWEHDAPHRCIGIAGALCTAAVFAIAPLTGDGHVALLACGTSTLGLALLDARRDHLPVEALRVLADVALLTAAIAFGS